MVFEHAISEEEEEEDEQMAGARRANTRGSLEVAAMLFGAVVSVINEIGLVSRWIIVSSLSFSFLRLVVSWIEAAVLRSVLRLLVVRLV